MSDELKASPRNEFLFSLAQKLRAAPGKLSQASPVLGTLSRAALGDIPQGLEHWAYGDSPLGPPANAPMFNEKALPMLEAAPIGALGPLAKGAALAQLVPARPLLNADATAAKRLADRIRGADDAIMQQATPDEVWKQFGLTRAPGNPLIGRTGKIGENAYHTRWLEEIDSLNRLKSKDSVRSARDVGDVFDSSKLFRQYPDLLDIQFKLGDPNKKMGGAYFPGARRIEMYRDLDDPDFPGIAAHELNHGIMDHFGQVNATGHGVDTPLTQTERNRLINMAGYMSADSFGNEKYGQVPEQLLEFARIGDGRTVNQAGAWDRSAGETLAEAVRKRRMLTPEVAKQINPAYQYPSKDYPLSDAVMDRGAQAARFDMPADVGGKTLVEILRRVGVLPSN
jgi:hypothetical protein